jgi:hypothetical protein
MTLIPKISEDQKPITEYIELKNTKLFWYFVPLLLIKNYFFIVFLVSILFVTRVRITSRFLLSYLFYEESSWFDGQIWEKPFFLLKYDRLIGSQKLEVIVRRYFRILVFLVIIWLCKR